MTFTAFSSTKYFIYLVILLGPGAGIPNCQVIDALNWSSNCAGLANYPLGDISDLAAGGVIGGMPVFCGGKTSSGEESACYAYNNTLDSWTLLANMAVSRRNAAAAVVNGALWVTGGYNTADSYLASSEFIFPNGTTSDGPDIPEDRIKHCMVTMHDGRVMLLGGHSLSEGFTDGKSTEIYDPYTNTFTAGPDMLFKRASLGVHFCLR